MVTHFYYYYHLVTGLTNFISAAVDISALVVSTNNTSYRLKQCSHNNLDCYNLSPNYTLNRLKALDPDSTFAYYQDEVVKEFRFAFDKYVQNAFGYDEFHPLSKSGKMFSDKGIGYTIIDSLDTMILMGLEKEVNLCLDYIKTNIDFNQTMTVNVFETTIRVLGGLLSAYFLLDYKQEVLLQLAIDLGNRLATAFDTNTGIIIPTINLDYNKFGFYETTSTSEATSLQLEFKYLSYLTNITSFWTKCELVMEVIANSSSKVSGLVPIFIDSDTGMFSGTEIRLGSRGDSYYEYLLKQYLLTWYQDSKYLERYTEAIQGIKDLLIGYSIPHFNVFVGEIDSSNTDYLIPKMDHLVCFLPGTLALGATNGYSIKEYIEISKLLNLNTQHSIDDDILLAQKIMETCYKMYTMHSTGLSAEVTKFKTHWNNATDKKETLLYDMYATQLDRFYILRPETVESLFYMFRITGDNKYRKWGWNIFKSIRKYCKSKEYGYSSIKDVADTKTQKIDKMESFFLSETLKYLYLLFSNTQFVPLHQTVFNTEAHVFPRFKK